MNPNNNFPDKEGVKTCKKSLTVRQIVVSLLIAKGWKQTDLADKIGITRQGLNNYISGRWEVPTQIKLKIAQALNVDSAVIWDLEGKHKEVENEKS